MRFGIGIEQIHSQIKTIARNIPTRLSIGGRTRCIKQGFRLKRIIIDHFQVGIISPCPGHDRPVGFDSLAAVNLFNDQVPVDGPHQCHPEIRIMQETDFGVVQVQVDHRQHRFTGSINGQIGFGQHLTQNRGVYIADALNLTVLVGCQGILRGRVVTENEFIQIGTSEEIGVKRFKDNANDPVIFHQQALEPIGTGANGREVIRIVDHLIQGHPAEHMLRQDAKGQVIQEGRIRFREEELHLRVRKDHHFHFSP